ncbi:M28 family peptidase [Candidatus Poseidonia alphae]|nr:M28 family peptidase [Candidatus Poseidonia alphae]
MSSRSSPRVTATWLCLIIAMMTLSTSVSSQNESQWNVEDEHLSLCGISENLTFSGTNANTSVSWQVSLGPRIPESEPSALFRSAVEENVTAWGWEVYTQQHERHGMNLTNLFATLNGTGDEERGRIVISAHYDSRNIADKDLNVSNQTLPVPGANDAASGAAILIELARIIPAMNLSQDITLFWNDAEDQNDNYTVGAEAWADNLSQFEIDNMESFVLLDMVGDRDLQLQKIYIGNSTLKSRAQALGGALGMVNGTVSCAGIDGDGTMQYNITAYVGDDHQHPDELGIPTLSFMDPQYGEKVPGTFGEYWHTMEDTPDKVSAESLGAVGRLVELGLKSEAFVIVVEEQGQPAQDNSTGDGDVEPLEPSKPKSRVITGLVILAGTSLFLIVGLIVFAEWKLKH